MSAQVNEVLNQIAECLQVDRALITEKTVAADVPAWDSMAVVELVFMLQRDYDLTLPPAQATTLTSVEAVLNVLRDAGKLA
ncbi:MAG TPA: acyl carrier protein [Planctomycetaceae bacterium]|nr:acyl carrier protein [Planctomycetaceae bacterium]